MLGRRCRARVAVGGCWAGGSAYTDAVFRCSSFHSASRDAAWYDYIRNAYKHMCRQTRMHFAGNPQTQTKTQTQTQTQTHEQRLTHAAAMLTWS